jgi:hypothetical protein
VTSNSTRSIHCCQLAPAGGRAGRNLLQLQLI